MRFRLLGALAVEDDNGRVVEVVGSKARSLLAFLLLRENEVTTRDALIEAIWDGAPPRSASHGLDVLISRLRRTLDGASAQPRLRTVPGGYVLDVRQSELDADRFENGVRRGREALGGARYAEAVEHLAHALDEWRGPALGDLAYAAFAEARTAQLEELRIDATEDLLEAELRLGRHLEALPVLEGLVKSNPLCERARALLMLALYRAGRHAEALETYRVARRLLAEQLGLDPSDELRRLEGEILRRDPALGQPDFTHHLRARTPPTEGAVTLEILGEPPFDLHLPQGSRCSSATPFPRGGCRTPASSSR